MAKKKVIKEKPKTWWQKMLCYILGMMLVILPLLLLASLLDYHAEDPSFNKATSGVAQNFLGSFGSYSADLILSTFGLSLIIFLLVPIIWGLGLLRYQAFAEYKARILAWIVGILCAACFLDLTCSGYLGKFNLPYNLTGEWSKVLSRPLNTYVNSFNFPYNSLLFEGIILFFALLSFNFAAGITFKLWLNLTTGIANVFRWCGKFIWSGVKKIAKIREYTEFKEINPSYLRSRMQRQNGGKLRIRREPGFERNDEPKLTMAAATPQNRISDTITDPTKPETIKPEDKLQIELPPAVAANAVAKNNSVNPTFAFVADGDAANQNTKKAARKITPQDIYQTEGVKSFAAKKTPAKEKLPQDDLLNVPTGAVNHSNENDLQQQVPASLNLPFAAEKIKEKTPTVTDEYQLPDIDLLTAHNETAIEYDEATLKANAARLEEVLKDFKINGQIVKVRPGPVVTLYELEPAPGTRTARVIGLSDDIARSMAVASVRMAVVSGHNTIGIELPNEKRETVWLRELFEDNDFKNSKNILNVALGKDIGGQHVYADLAKMPHLLVAGTTGSGKSVGVNSMILSLIYRLTPEQCKFIMIDPKQLEFSMYNGIPHLLTPVITDPGKAVVGLKWAVREMEDRYRAMALLNVRNIAGYNQKVKEMQNSGKEIKKTIQTGFDKETGRPIYEEQIIDTKPMPYIVIVVDEMADLMLVAGKEVEAAIQRLAQMARAAGIHLIMSTQRPSVDVITGTIKANFPSRISFHVTTKIDSRTILGEQGAEQLLGMGDMLYMPSGLRPIRVHGCFVTDGEVERVVEYVKSQGEPSYVSDVTEGEVNSKDSGAVFDKGEIAGGADDDLYRQAVEIVRTDKKASTSYIQRKLRLGYNRAAILIERMEDEGIVTPPDRVGRRQVVGFED